MIEQRTQVQGVGQVALTVTNVAQARDFYRDVLGLTHLFDAGPNLSFLDAGGLRIMLTAPEGAGEPGKNSTLYYKVADVEAAYAAVLEKGATGDDGPHMIAKMPDHELWMAFVRDPDGNLVGLMEERR